MRHGLWALIVAASALAQTTTTVAPVTTTTLPPAMQRQPLTPEAEAKLREAYAKHFKASIDAGKEWRCQTYYMNNAKTAADKAFWKPRVDSAYIEWQSKLHAFQSAIPKIHKSSASVGIAGYIVDEAAPDVWPVAEARIVKILDATNMLVEVGGACYQLTNFNTRSWSKRASINLRWTFNVVGKTTNPAWKDGQETVWSVETVNDARFFPPNAFGGLILEAEK